MGRCRRLGRPNILQIRIEHYALHSGLYALPHVVRLIIPISSVDDFGFE